MGVDPRSDRIFSAGTGYLIDRQRELAPILFGHAIELFGGLSRVDEGAFVRRVDSREELERFLQDADEYRQKRAINDPLTYLAYIQRADDDMEDALTLDLTPIFMGLECNTERPIRVGGTLVSAHDQEVRDELTREFGLLPGIMEFWNGPHTLFVGDPYLLYRHKAVRHMATHMTGIRPAKDVFWRVYSTVTNAINYDSMVEIVLSAAGGNAEAIPAHKVAVRFPADSAPRRATIRTIGRVVQMRLHEAGVPIDWEP